MRPTFVPLAVLLIAPSAAADGAMTLRATPDRGNGWRLEVRARGPVELVADAGAIAFRGGGKSDRTASWRIAPGRRPSYAVAAAFAGADLVGWVAVPRPAQLTLSLDAEPNADVSVLVDGRRFAGRADGAGVARVAVIVPPGVRRAIAIESGDRLEIDLGSSRIEREHVLVAPSGHLWLFHTDEMGRPTDREASAELEPVSVGAYRIRGSMRSGAATLTTLEPWMPRDARPHPRSVHRVGAGVPFAQRWTPSAGVMAARSLRTLPLGARVGGQLLLGRSRHRVFADRDDATRSVASFAAWMEATVARGVFGWRLAGSLGVGGGASWRRVDPDFQRSSQRWAAGPLVTTSLSVGRGPFDLELRALASTSDLGADDGGIHGFASLGWIWVP